MSAHILSKARLHLAAFPPSQAPVFISFFIALRKMAYLPVPSLQTGGALWFPDLTMADPFYLLPIAVTGTMFFILEVGGGSSGAGPNRGPSRLGRDNVELNGTLYFPLLSGRLENTFFQSDLH